MTAPHFAEPAADGRAVGPAPIPSFEALYHDYFGFVWRTLWRLGVSAASVADAAQDVFLVVHRRGADLQGEAVAKSWLYGIVVRVARDYRRAQLRRDRGGPIDPERMIDHKTANGSRHLEQQQAVELLNRLLDTLDDDKRETLVLVELEQMSVPEIAELLHVNLNTVYTRLRAARQEFTRALARHRAKQKELP